MSIKVNPQENLLSTFSPEIRTTRPLTKEQIAQYHRDGYVIIPNFFDIEEIEPIRKACEADPDMQGVQATVNDRAGGYFKVALWSELGNTLLGVMPRMARMVDTVETLLGRECYHWHSKIVRKLTNDGQLHFHQDYATWYEDGCLFPHHVTCTIAIDKSDKENGCVKMVPGSHELGRIHRVRIGKTKDTHCPDPFRIGKVLEKLGIVYCEMEPGDAMFFHSNTLHGSDPNKSDRPRTLMHCSYNAVSNEPIIHEGQEHHLYRPLIKLPDSVIKEGRYNSVFDGHIFHTPETEGSPGAGIFFRRVDSDVVYDN
ncbi:phytanoyl-CoA dioxygenase family protein [Nodularia spumigena]|uniref:phytanoyl-CoA dioxygenase family protein n=1 Tax=Nodularia spumigena TaxID=70799 RepID=UPI00232AE1FA|nr:phytanoyl-CoA dioxygenase family protein [Nodularia spumigena]MDB9317674.1 phytanoyl-CoA dioxygenase family protein [Nodularia spumigena CS-590/01A]MDB9326828.1 phytanoyl-CoA dioxygenase family protein [Nodularia spumigena CS-590/02]MDB9337058.1 phytanoyl-CoA dioxygenase family protein [Nodularia spumigena CS-590/01]